jgi:hypothetical protein
MMYIEITLAIEGSNPASVMCITYQCVVLIVAYQPVHCPWQPLTTVQIKALNTEILYALLLFTNYNLQCRTMLLKKLNVVHYCAKKPATQLCSERTQSSHRLTSEISRFNYPPAYVQSPN